MRGTPAIGLMMVLLGMLMTRADSASAQISLIPVKATDCAAPCPRTAVIFVHGLTGSQETWVNANGASFPKLLGDDPDFDQRLDVYSINYLSLWSSGAPVVEVTKQVSALLDDLVKAKGYPKVAFVAHSLGGNITREYLAHVKLRYGHAALSRFRMVITLGTPTQGASLGALAALFSDNPQVRSLLDIRKNDFLQLLEETELNYVAKKLQNHCNDIEFDAGFEMRPVALALIVSEDSATNGATRSKGFDKNHIELPKPADRTDAVYGWVRDELQLCVGGEDRCKASPNPQPLCMVGDF